MSSERSDFEDLAAFADGRLSGEARTAVLDRLAADEEYYELLTDLLRFQQEEETAGATGKLAEVVAHPSWLRRRRGWIAAVAALVPVALGFVLLLRSASIGPLETMTAELDATELAELGGAWDERLWSALRGSQLPFAGRRDAFRLGARSVDLHLALQAGHRELATEYLMEMTDLLRGDARTGSAAARYEGLLGALRERPAPELVRSSLRAAADLEPLVDGFYFDYGVWARSGWWAAKAGARNHFQLRAVRGFVERGDVPEAERDRLNELEAAIERRDLEALEAGLLDLLKSVGAL